MGISNLRHLALYWRTMYFELDYLPDLKFLRTLTVVYDCPGHTIETLAPEAEAEIVNPYSMIMYDEAGWMMEYLETTFKSMLMEKPDWKVPLVRWRAEPHFFENPHASRVLYEEMERKGEATQSRIMSLNTRYPTI